MTDFSLGVVLIDPENIHAVLLKIEREYPKATWGPGMNPTSITKILPTVILNGITSISIWKSGMMYYAAGMYLPGHTSRWDMIISASDFLGKFRIASSSTLFIPSTTFIPLEY